MLHLAKKSETSADVHSPLIRPFP